MVNQDLSANRFLFLSVALRLRLHVQFLAACCLGLILLAGPAAGESPAPTVHWGGLAYPDQSSTFSVGGTVNRFTEFDNPSRNSIPYESTVHESFGLNFFSLSWTKVWECSICVEGLATNLTVGAGPTSEQPSRSLQNIHNAFNVPQVSTGRIRGGADAMVDASVTKWFSFQRSGLIGEEFGDTFVGAGFSGGTLYQELFFRGGFRRLELPTEANLPVRFSMMGRYSRLFTGSLLHTVPSSSTVLQPAISFGPYAVHGPVVPPWEIEIAITWDSGLFANEAGRARHERFWSFSYRYHGFRFETWNDSLINDKDRGPTFGGTLTYNLLQTWMD
jgi:hypothetical protein